MKYKIFRSNNDWTGFITRVTMGCIMFPHGAQKLLGAFNGFGFNATMQFFAETVHLPSIIGFLVIMIEFFGSICLVIGLATRIWSALFIAVLLGMIFTFHSDNGFFMNWYGTQKGEGMEYSLLFLGLSLTTLFNGGGKFSFDTLLYSKMTNKNNSL